MRKDEHNLWLNKGVQRMKILVDGKVYDSTEIPVLIVFDQNEQEMFSGMKKYVSAPPEATKEERQKLMDTEI